MKKPAKVNKKAKAAKPAVNRVNLGDVKDPIQLEGSDICSKAATKLVEDLKKAGYKDPSVAIFSLEISGGAIAKRTADVRNYTPTAFLGLADMLCETIVSCANGDAATAIDVISKSMAIMESKARDAVMKEVKKIIGLG